MKNKDNTEIEGFNLLVLKALGFFIENPYEEIYLREFSRRLNINPNTAQRFLNLFLREGLIKEERKANSRYFKSNTESLLFKYIKKTYSIKKIQDSGLTNFLRDKFSSIILFGSMAKGLDDNNSDVDLVFIGREKKIDLHEFEKKIKKQINSHFFTISEWRRQKEQNKAFYQDVISDGINLIGEVPIID